ncbi:hypothetical protein BAL199_29065 [alpha proteobacterium BAL199]|nr:hypothetical protein BAL199_29065 [alpha proteobacterium BAL199]
MAGIKSERRPASDRNTWPPSNRYRWPVLSESAIIKRSDVAKGFEVLPRRWVVERTLAWLSRNRRLAKDFEQTIASASAWLFVASVQIFTRRIARHCKSSD